jgi:hypothetical protein
MTHKILHAKVERVAGGHTPSLHICCWSGRLQRDLINLLKPTPSFDTAVCLLHLRNSCQSRLSRPTVAAVAALALSDSVGDTRRREGQADVFARAFPIPDSWLTLGPQNSQAKQAPPQLSPRPANDQDTRGTNETPRNCSKGRSFSFLIIDIACERLSNRWSLG